MEFNPNPLRFYDYNTSGYSHSLHWCFHCPSPTKWVSTSFPHHSHPLQQPVYPTPTPPQNPPFPLPVQLEMISNSINTIQDLVMELKERNSRMHSTFSNIQSLLQEMQSDPMTLDDVEIEETTLEDAIDTAAMGCIGETASALVEGSSRNMDYSMVQVHVLDESACEREFALAAGNSKINVHQVFDTCSHRAEPTFIEHEVMESLRDRTDFFISNEIRLMPQLVFIQLPFDPGTWEVGTLFDEISGRKFDVSSRREPFEYDNSMERKVFTTLTNMETEAEIKHSVSTATQMFDKISQPLSVVKCDFEDENDYDKVVETIDKHDEAESVTIGVSIQKNLSRRWLLLHLVFLRKLKVPPDIMFESLVVHLDVTRCFSIAICCGVIRYGSRATMLRQLINGLALSGNQKGWKSIVQANFLVLDTWTTIIKILELLLEGNFLNIIKVTNSLLVKFYLTYCCDSLFVGHSKKTYTRQGLAKEIIMRFVEMSSREHLVESSLLGKQFSPEGIVFTVGVRSANNLYTDKAVVIFGGSGSGNRLFGSLIHGSYVPNKGRVLLSNLDTRTLHLRWLIYTILLENNLYGLPNATFTTVEASFSTFIVSGKSLVIIGGFDEELGYMLPVVAASNIHGYTVVKGILSSNAALALSEVPLQLLVISASYIGLGMGFMWGCRCSGMIVGEFVHALFYLTEGARILSEMSALLGLINETWLISGINMFIHYLFFAGVLFERYCVPSQVDVGALLAMLTQVAHDATNANREPFRILKTFLNALPHWIDKGLFHSHGNVHRGIVRLMEIIHYLLCTMLKIVEANIPGDTIVAFEKGEERKNVFSAMPIEMSNAGENFDIAKVLRSFIMLAKALSKSHVDLKTMNSIREGSILHYGQIVADCTLELPWSVMNSGEIVTMQNDNETILECKFPNSNLEDKVLIEGGGIVVNLATMEGPLGKMSNYIWDPGGNAYI